MLLGVGVLNVGCGMCNVCVCVVVVGCLESGLSDFEVSKTILVRHVCVCLCCSFSVLLLFLLLVVCFFVVRCCW